MRGKLEKPKEKPSDYIYDLHITAIRSELSQWLKVALWVGPILALTTIAIVLYMNRGELTFEGILGTLLFGVAIVGITIVAPFGYEVFRLLYSKPYLIQATTKRVGVLSPDPSSRKAIKAEAEDEKAGTTTATLLPLFFFTLFVGALNSIIHLPLIWGAFWLILGSFLFVGIAERLIESQSAEILTRAITRYEFLVNAGTTNDLDT